MFEKSTAFKVDSRILNLFARIFGDARRLDVYRSGWNVVAGYHIWKDGEITFLKADAQIWHDDEYDSDSIPF